MATEMSELHRIRLTRRAEGGWHRELTYAGIGRILLGKVGLVAVLITLAVGVAAVFAAASVRVAAGGPTGYLCCLHHFHATDDDPSIRPHSVSL